MFDAREARCFRCGQPGHTRRNCPQASHSPPASPSGRPAQWKPIPSTGPPHIYPADHWLLYACEFCGAAPFVQCHNTGTGRQRRPHHIRIDTYGPAVMT